MRGGRVGPTSLTPEAVRPKRMTAQPLQVGLQEFTPGISVWPSSNHPVAARCTYDPHEGP